MNKYLRTEHFRNLMAGLAFERDRFLKEFENLPEGRLSIRPGSKKGQIYYMWRVGEKRIGITGNDELIHKLARKRYLEVAIKTIEKNILYLETFMDHYKDIDYQDVLNELPPEHRRILNYEASRWAHEKTVWQTSSYRQSTYKPNEKCHVTTNGLHVRSKSELIIAEIMDIYNLAYRYEEMIDIRNRSYAPDFTILTKKGLVWWEHCGLVNDSHYMHNHNWKMNIYRSVGIVPWKNLIVTYEGEDGYLDTRIIEAEIQNKILPYC